MAASALALFAVGVLRACVTHRHPSPGMRAGTGLVLVLLAVGAAVGLRSLAMRIAQSLEIDAAHVLPGPLSYLGPVLFAVGVFALGNLMLRGQWAGRRALLFYTWLLAFTVANIINRCSPGWCETIGLPFAWRSSSDSFITLIGDTDRLWTWLPGVASALGGAVNLMIFAAVAGALARAGTSRPSA
jgi:hypothetical protein